MSLLIDDTRGLLNIGSPNTREGESLVLREVFRGWIGDAAGTNASLSRDPEARESVRWGLELQSSQ
jgi:hypothetical protein